MTNRRRGSLQPIGNSDHRHAFAIQLAGLPHPALPSQVGMA
jgi:hypothetical protein